MFHKILAALDSSDTRHEVFDKACAIAQASGASLMLLHVLSADDEGSPPFPVRPHIAYYSPMDEVVWDTYQKQWEAFEREGLAQLQTLANQAVERGVTAEITQATGSPGRTICNLARTWQADMIIMGSHQRKGLSELLLGSVSNYVTHHAPCSVLIIHPAVGQQQATAQAATAELVNS